MNKCIGNFIRRSFICIFSLLCCIPTFAGDTTSGDTTQTPTAEAISPSTESSPPQSMPANPGIISRTLTSLENIRDITSERYISWSRAIDSFLSGKKIEEGNNNSNIRLDLQHTIYKAGDTNDDVHLNARLDLPNTEKQLKLVFSSNPIEDQTIQQRIEENATGQRVQKEGSIAGLEYRPKPEEKQTWQHSLTGGIRLKLNPIPFTRYKIEKDWGFTQNWDLKFHQSFWYYEDKGTGATSDLALTNPWSKKDLFAIAPLVEYHNRENIYYYALVISNTHRVTPQSSLQYRIGALGTSEPTSEVSNYFIDTQYHRVLYKDWLFLNLTPALNFPRSEQWHAQPAFTAGVKIYFQ